jgi:hypothetical protein
MDGNARRADKWAVGCFIELVAMKGLLRKCEWKGSLST